MKNRLISLLYLLALAFSTNLLADDEEYNEPQKEEQKEEPKPESEGELPEAKNGLILHEGNVDSLFMETLTKVLGAVLSKGGMPHEHAKKIAEEATQEVHKEVAKEEAAKKEDASKANDNMKD